MPRVRGGVRAKGKSTQGPVTPGNKQLPTKHGHGLHAHHHDESDRKQRESQHRQQELFFPKGVKPGDWKKHLHMVLLSPPAIPRTPWRSHSVKLLCSRNDAPNVIMARQERGVPMKLTHSFFTFHTQFQAPGATMVSDAEVVKTWTSVVFKCSVSTRDMVVSCRRKCALEAVACLLCCISTKREA